MSTTLAEACNMANYFIREKGDVTRWTDWEQHKDMVLAAVPELQDALNQQRTADTLMKAACTKLQNLAGEYDES